MWACHLFLRKCSALLFFFFGLTGHGGSEHYQGQGEAWCSQGALHVLWRVLSLLKCENGEFFCKDSWARHVAWWSRDGSDGIRTGHTEPMWSPRRLKSKPRRNRPMPNRSHGTMAKSEKAHIEAEEKQTDAEQGPWNQSIVRAGSYQCRGGKDRCRTGPMEPKHSPSRLTSKPRRCLMQPRCTTCALVSFFSLLLLLGQLNGQKRPTNIPYYSDSLYLCSA